MADVTPPPERRRAAGGRGARGSDRGQLFLVGALALSVILVTLAVLLNTAIYTGNVATRDPGTGSGDVVEFESAAAEAASRSLVATNYEDNESYAALDANVTDSVDAWSTAATKHAAVLGADAYAGVAGTTEGTRIVQGTNRQFTDAEGDAVWDVATGVQVRNFTMTVDQPTLPEFTDDDDASDFDNTFHVDVHDTATGDEWEVYVYEHSDEVRVATVKNGGTLIDRCGTTTNNPTVDLTNASVAGSHCEALTFWDETDGPYDLQYMDVGTAGGTYSLVVDVDHSTLATVSEYNDDAGASPYVTPALYSATVEVTYRSPTVYYRSQVRVAPGEYDA